MKSKFYIVIVVTIIATILFGCSKQAPKCSDDETIKLTRKIIYDQIGGSEGLTDKEIQENMIFELPRATAHDEKIKKYSCEAKLIAGNAYQLPVIYESQLDDKGQHIVSVGGIRRGDLLAVHAAIKESLSKSRAPKNEAAQAVPVTPPPPAAPAVQQNQSSSVEQSGICKGLDLSITSEQIECLDRKYTTADKELNNIYKQTMSRLDASRKAALKKEQVAWIKEKESKCAKAGKEAEGGSLEAVMIKDCFVQETEQRLTYLKSFK
jgi:uncharacterized protein YecT (DUF1311 family)